MAHGRRPAPKLPNRMPIRNGIDLGEIAHENRTITQTVDVGADYTSDEIEFQKTMDTYKRVYRRPFPTWREVMKIFEYLGYRKGN